MDARRSVWAGKEFLEQLSKGGDLQIRGDIEIEVSP